jgi:hypothetical protein
MTKTSAENLQFKDLLDKSRAVKLLLSSYQEALHKLAGSDDYALQRTIALILKREKPTDLQSVYFTEEVLQKFVESNLEVPDQNALIEEYRDKARQLIKTFLFFGEKEKNEILPYIDTLDLDGLKKLIELYQMGHHKQDQYLRVFAEKDPKMAIKFELLVTSAGSAKKQK